MSRGWLKKFHLSLKEFHEVPNAVHSGQVQVGFGMLLSPHIITWVPNICQSEHSLAFCYPWKSLFSWPPLTSPSLQPCAVVRTDYWGDVRRMFNATNQDIFLVCNLRTWKSRTHDLKKSKVCCDVEDITESRRKRRWIETQNIWAREAWRHVCEEVQGKPEISSFWCSRGLDANTQINWVIWPQFVLPTKRNHRLKHLEIFLQPFPCFSNRTDSTEALRFNSSWKILHHCIQ